MHKAYAVAEFPHHRRAIIVSPHSERARTQTEPVGRIRNGSNQLAKILSGGKDARQPENRIRRVIRVDDHFCATFISNRTYLLQEENQVGAKLLCINAVISGKCLAELLQGKAFLAARKTSYHIAGNQIDLLRSHSLVSRPGLGDILL